MKPRNVRIPDELWERAEQTALRVSLDEGERVTISDLVRRGLRRECERMERLDATGGRE